ncbi:HAMP domain-containing sensor histidine kinase [Rhizobium sp. 11515TR]|uniref:sensor histidine kinase n=1 Tax=unclassified Rhizobium TaxID=2613769 RepID=UPI000BA8B3B0|nr:ATP-binding protein [Rhizobium sp. 11515TR]ASW05926.1 two-component sensor histidine kinase [Rhizobium sp. 11515TR]
MRVLSDISVGTVALVDRVGRSWLSRTSGDGEVRGQELAILRRLALASSVALFAVPAGLSLVTSPAVALPAGVATVCAAFLFSAVGSIALSRQRPALRPAEAVVVEHRDLMLESAFGLVLLLDPQGNVTTVGGRDRAEFLCWMRDPTGRGFVEQIHVSDRIVFLQAIDVLRQGRDAHSADLRLERSTVVGGDDQFVHARMELTARRDAEGRLTAIVSQLRDISQDQQLREDAARKAAEAESANDAKSRFLAAVSHELRTPLNAILGFSDILSGEYFGKLENDRQREYVGLIRQSGAHLLSVVNTMLDMSKIEAGRYELMLESFAIEDTIATCEAMLGLQAKEKGLTLTSRIQRGLGEIVADQRAIQQILINLIGNAIKFTDAGGAITIDAALADGMLKLSIGDTGIGIASERLASLGQPFVQIQNDYTRRYAGTGLGLSLVKGLVGLHGGNFSIASAPGEGTVITILIPFDGSGAVTMQQPVDVNRAVDFPPRLKHTVEIDEGRNKELMNGPAKAKIA